MEVRMEMRDRHDNLNAGHKKSYPSMVNGLSPNKIYYSNRKNGSDLCQILPRNSSVRVVLTNFFRFFILSIPLKSHRDLPEMKYDHFVTCFVFDI